MKFLQQQNVMILGLGISGLAMARWCVKYGATVTILDSRANPPQWVLLKTEMPEVNFVCSQFELAVLDSAQFNFIFTSPGIKPVDASDLLAYAKTNGVQTGNELTLFNLALRDLSESEAYKPNVLAITGTNGKTTVTSLTGKLVACSNMTVAIAGNIGPSLLDTLSEKITRHELPQVWVLELSSFQLTDVTDFEPASAVVLNMTQDHLDWHGSMDAYIRAKSSIYGSKSTKMVVNRDDATVITMLENAQKVNKNRKFCTFGEGLPNRLGDYGLESVNGVTWLVRAISIDDAPIKKQRSLLESPAEFSIQRLIPSDALLIRGQHNMLNAIAALSLVDAIGCSISRVLYGLRQYKGEPHRVELIGNFKGIEYFDDSKGTNVGATVAAISGLGKERKIIVILGGEGKGQDFSPLIDVVSKYVDAVILIGKDKDIIKDILKNVNVPTTVAQSLQEAVIAADEYSKKSEQRTAVLLSPACASLDMFDNYEHRGREFRAIVERLFAKQQLDVQDVSEVVQ